MDIEIERGCGPWELLWPCVFIEGIVVFDLSELNVEVSLGKISNIYCKIPVSKCNVLMDLFYDY